MPPEELANIWRRYSSRLLLIARSIGEPAEDAVQEAFLQLSRQAAAPNDPLAWLVTVTRNQLLQWHRSGQRRRRREQAEQPSVWFDGEAAKLDATLDAQHVTDALRDLSPDQRQVIVMHLWGEMSFDAIATLMGSSRSSAHRTFQSGIRDMRQRFNPDPTSSLAVRTHE
ncbi:sigma-70 family RNA polymerase sigma factor [Stieleria sp. TO1_6]|uniref:RNA polymerase sigma factor n=1 Tax=Stieleria tagensis TaxID=2956795 RepID=UPI00209B889F|nr:sigma-70 family RNA polymerase sigma factor [Stieleria tagensis]MCO8124686.1 sigma-70 family RNA polymerase sigma factor [Stieleria tagensis]